MRATIPPVAEDVTLLHHRLAFDIPVSRCEARRKQRNTGQIESLHDHGIHFGVTTSARHYERCCEALNTARVHARAVNASLIKNSGTCYLRE